MNLPSGKVQVTPTFVASAAVGACIGAFISWIVNCTLVEISVNAFFSIYFGVLFVVVGVFMLWRIKSQDPADQEQKKLEHAFSIIVIVAGLLCFLLKKNWCVGLTPIMKIPLYTILGTSISFALTFSLVDLANYAIGFFQQQNAKNLVESRQQIYVILCTTMLMGAVFGTIFGIMDVEDASRYQLRLALLKEEKYCFPIGVVLGGLAGAGNEYLRSQGMPYSRLDPANFSPYDDDI